MDAIKNKAMVHVDYYCALLFRTKKIDLVHKNNTDIYLQPSTLHISLQTLLREHEG